MTYVLFHLRHHQQLFYYVLCHLGHHHRQQHLSLLNRRVFFVTSGSCDNDSTHSYTSLLLLPSGPRIYQDNPSHSPRTQADSRCDNLRKEREFGIITKQGKVSSLRVSEVGEHNLHVFLHMRSMYCLQSGLFLSLHLFLFLLQNPDDTNVWLWDVSAVYLYDKI